jgi:hypothetical protein
MATSPKQELRAHIISCRNRLAAGHRDGAIIESIDQALELIPMVDVAITQSLLQEWLPLARDAYLADRSDEVVHILDFLHNLPLTEGEATAWDLRYFLVMELPRFLETFSIQSAPIDRLLATLGAIREHARWH